MSNTRFYAAILLTAIVTCTLVLTLAPPARAETTRTAVCTVKLPGKGADGGNDGLQTWMTEQLVQGRTQFISALNAGNLHSLCGW